jgi:hypothetical protein
MRTWEAAGGSQLPAMVMAGEGDAPSARAASLASSAALPVSRRSAWRGRVGPYASPYAARSRTPSWLRRRVRAGHALRGASRPQQPRPTGPPWGNGARLPQGALRAIDSSAGARSWRTYSPRRLRRQSQACPGCHPGWCLHDQTVRVLPGPRPAQPGVKRSPSTPPAGSTRAGAQAGSSAAINVGVTMPTWGLLTTANTTNDVYRRPAGGRTISTGPLGKGVPTWHASCPCC